jgi:hypothetical protein
LQNTPYQNGSISVFSRATVESNNLHSVSPNTLFERENKKVARTKVGVALGFCVRVDWYFGQSSFVDGYGNYKHYEYK